MKGGREGAASGAAEGRDGAGFDGAGFDADAPGGVVKGLLKGGAEVLVEGAVKFVARPEPKVGPVVHGGRPEAMPLPPLAISVISVLISAL